MREHGVRRLVGGSVAWCGFALLATTSAALVGHPLASSGLRQPSAAGSRAASAAGLAMVADQIATSAPAEPKVGQSVRGTLALAKEKYGIPEDYAALMDDFFACYMAEVHASGGDPAYYETMLTNLLKQVLQNTAKPHTFEPFHTSIREPFDFYKMGVDFARGLVDRERSVVRGMANVERIQQQLAAGDNVVLLANHQTEADPQVLSLLLDDTHPGFAQQTIFVAGDRVTTDALAMPFSMGRNLLCIFSKRHVENPPEKKAEKQKHNRMVMKRMGALFKEGGKCVWVAPSGGRDRPDADGDYQVAPFDAKSVEMFRLLSDKAGRQSHMYPLSMMTFPVCPPPVAVGGAVGERRTVKHAPVGLHFGDAIDLEAFEEGCLTSNFPAGCTDESPREALRDALASHCHATVKDNYRQLASDLL